MIDKDLMQAELMENEVSFQELMDFVNGARRIMRVDGPLDMLRPGETGHTKKCPIAMSLIEDAWPGYVHVEGQSVSGRVNVSKSDPHWCGVYSDWIKALQNYPEHTLWDGSKYGVEYEIEGWEMANEYEAEGWEMANGSGYVFMFGFPNVPHAVSDFVTAFDDGLIVSLIQD